MSSRPDLSVVIPAHNEAPNLRVLLPQLRDILGGLGIRSEVLAADVIGKGLQLNDLGVDNAELIAVNESIRSHPIEVVGKKLRKYMTAMKKVI